MPGVKEVLEEVAELSDNIQKRKVSETAASYVPPPANNVATFLDSLKCVAASLHTLSCMQ